MADLTKEDDFEKYEGNGRYDSGMRDRSMTLPSRSTSPYPKSPIREGPSLLEDLRNKEFLDRAIQRESHTSSGARFDKSVPPPSISKDSSGKYYALHRREASGNKPKEAVNMTSQSPFTTPRQ